MMKNVAGFYLFLALLPGCSSLFDSPRGSESVNQAVALKSVNDLAAASNPQQVVAAIPGAQSAVDATTSAATKKSQETTANATSGLNKAKKSEKSEKDESPNKIVVEPGKPELKVESGKANMPELAVMGLDDAALEVDGKPAVLGNPTRGERIALLAIGRHTLRVTCPFDPLFSADVDLIKGDRVVLRGQCSPTRQISSQARQRE